MPITSLNDVAENVLTGKLTYESRDRGRLWGILKGPYYQHNQLVRHAEKLKEENDEAAPRYFRLFPMGGGYSLAPDVILFAIWQLLLVYPLGAIGAACLCQNVVNLVNAVVLSLLMVAHVSCMWLVTKNWKKFKRSWYVAKVKMKNHFGMENRLSNVTIENIQQNEYLNRLQKQRILSKLNVDNRKNGCAVIMIVTDSYWASKVLDPIIALCSLGVLCLVSLILQIEFYSMEPGS